MNSGVLILIAEAMAVYVLVLLTYALRRRAGLAPFYALLGGITAVMSWVTDAGVHVELGGMTFMVGSTVFYTALLLGVFVVYVFDGPVPTRTAILTVAGVSALVPVIAAVLHVQMSLTGQGTPMSIPTPSLRINTASVLTTVADLVFLAVFWEWLGKQKPRIGLWIRAFVALLGVMWLDVLLFSTGAFFGRPEYLSIMKGTLLSRLVIATFAWPFLYAYLAWQTRLRGAEIQNRPVLAILREVAQMRGELGLARQEIDRIREMERALRDSEQRYRAVFEGAAEGILIADAETREFRYANPAICALLRYTVAELTHMDVRDIHPEESLPAIIAAFEGLARGQLRMASERPCLRKDGRIIYTDINTSRVEIGGRPCLVGFFTEVTARRLAQEEMRLSKAFLDRVINAIADPVFVKDDTRRFVLVNDALCRIVGRSRESLIGEDGDNMFPPEQVEIFRKVDAQVLETGEENLNEEALSNLSTGEVRTIVTRKSRYIDHSGRRFTVGVIRDISDRKRMEAELRRQQNMASIGALARGMAHEINNPIMGVMNYAQLIRDRTEDNATLVEFADEILAEGRRVSTMTHSLLDFTQQQNEQPFTPAVPADIISSVLASITETARQRGIDLSCDIPADLPPVACRHHQLGEVLTALLANAMEVFDDDLASRGKDRRIVIRARDISGDKPRDTPYAMRVTVEDNGPGIPEAIHDRVFDPFFTTKDRTRHSGLGLWICRSIVHEHGGEMTIQSGAVKGTQVHADLPADGECGMRNAERDLGRTEG